MNPDTILIPFGQDVLLKRSAFLKVFGHGHNNFILVSPPRVGKTAIGKNLAVEIGVNYYKRTLKKRTVLIMDYAGEWKGHITRPNWKSENPSWFIKPAVYDDFTFKISQFCEPQDFISLGFTPTGCQLISMVINKLYKHYKDDVGKFGEIINKLPTTYDQLAEWNALYHELILSRRINEATVVSLTNHLEFIKEWFWQGKQDQRPTFDFGKELLHKDCLIIDLSAGVKGTDPNRARAWCGLIFKQMRPYLHIKKPAIFIEEAHYFAPNLGQASFHEWPSSLIQVRDLFVTLPKKGIATFIFCQNEGQLHPDFANFAHTKIMNRAKGSGEEYVMQKKFGKWNPDFGEDGWRQFFVWNSDGTFQVVVPNTTPCMT